MVVTQFGGRGANPWPAFTFAFNFYVTYNLVAISLANAKNVTKHTCRSHYPWKSPKSVLVQHDGLMPKPSSQVRPVPSSRSSYRI